MDLSKILKKKYIHTAKSRATSKKRGKEGGKERGRKEYDGYARKERKWNQIKYLFRTCANAYSLSPPGPGPGPLSRAHAYGWLRHPKSA